MLLQYVLIFLAAGLGALGQLFLKISGGKILSYEFIIGGLLYVLAMLIYVRALRSIPLSVAYPTLAVSYILVVFLSYYFLGEQISIIKFIGIVFIFLGVSLIGIGS